MSETKVTPIEITNPYKFAVQGSAEHTIGANTVGIVHFDTEYFDTNNNFAMGTYKYIAPIDGYYQFNASVRIDNPTISLMQLCLIAGTVSGKSAAISTNGQVVLSSSTLTYCTAGTECFVNMYNGSGTATILPAIDSRFSGYLVSI